MNQPAQPDQPTQSARPPQPAQPQTALVPLDRPPGRSKWTFEHAGHVYAVFAVGSELYVTDNACPHNGGPLADGLLRDGGDDGGSGVITCPWHWYSYELATGRCRTAPGYELRRYPVIQVDGQPCAALPPRPPAPTWSQILGAHARRLPGEGEMGDAAGR